MSRQVPTFRVDPFWPKTLPNRWILGAVAGVAVDSRDHVWITHRPSTLQPNETRSIWKAAPPVLEFDPNGTLVSSWGGPGAGYDWPQLEHGIYVDDKDNVWLGAGGEKDAHILKFTRAGKFLMQIGKPGQSTRQQRHGEPRRTGEHRRRRRGQRALRRRWLRESPRHRVRRDDRRIQAPLGRIRQDAGRRVVHARGGDAAGTVSRRRAERKQAEPIRSERPAGSAIPHRPCGAHLERWPGLRVRPHERSFAGVHEGRRLRARGRHQQRDARAAARSGTSASRRIRRRRSSTSTTERIS